MLGEELKKYGDDIEMWGHSSGARMAIGLAAVHFAETGDQIEKLSLIEPIGSEKSSLLKTAFGFIVNEGIKMMKYSKRSPYNELSLLPNHNGRPRRRKTWIERFRACYQTWVSLPVSLGKPGLESDLEQALPAVKEKIAVLSPEHSGLNKPEVVRDVLSRLAKKADRPQKIEQVVLPDDSHSIISAGAGARVGATLYKKIAGQDEPTNPE
jgi:hypothetical protein